MTRSGLNNIPETASRYSRYSRSLTRTVVFANLLFAVASAWANETPRIAIIIDDLGYALAAGERVINLPGPVACAVLPQAPYSKHLARAVHASGKEVLLHLPLQAIDSTAPREAGDLHLDMSRAQFADAFARHLSAVPHVSGVNNHQGSMLTRHPGHMTWLMDEMAARDNLFFVDSFTTAASVALSIAREVGIPALRRNVFLDADQTPASIAREFEHLKKTARQNGFAVGIGHPYPATLDFLERELPRLAEDGIELIGLRHYLGQNVR